MLPKSKVSGIHTLYPRQAASDPSSEVGSQLIRTPVKSPPCGSSSWASLASLTSSANGVGAPGVAMTLAFSSTPHSPDPARDCNSIGVSILPDAELSWNEERGHYDFGDIDFTELFEVIKGNGPCNEQRMAHRRGAHEDGAWVREAAAAYADKRRSETEAAA